MGLSTSSYQRYRDLHLTVAGGSLRVLEIRAPRDTIEAHNPASAGVEPTKIMCFMFNKEWSLDDAIYIDRSEQQVFAGCPICAAHGKRSSHLIWYSLDPAPNEDISMCGTSKTKTAASEMATVGTGA